MAVTKSMEDNLKKNKLVSFAIGGGILVFVTLVIALLYFSGYIFPTIDPMAQYKTERQCTFMSDTARAYCIDGTVWSVSPVSPLP